MMALMAWGGQARPSIQWGDSGFVKDDIKYRTRPRSRKSHLFWLIAITAFIAFLDLLA